MIICKYSKYSCIRNKKEEMFLLLQKSYIYNSIYLSYFADYSVSNCLHLILVPYYNHLYAFLFF